MSTPEHIQLASNAVRELRVALSNYFLYTSENAMVQKSLERFLESLGSLFDDSSVVVLAEAEGRLMVDGMPLDERLTGSTNMVKDIFMTHKIHSLSFSDGVTADELRQLFALLRPRALPTGLSLSQALVQQPLEHIGLNEKVFVALAEGEVVVPADSASGGPMGGQNLEEALEALQYFLQIFAKVRPDSNKQEVAKRLMAHMGGWLGMEGEQITGGSEAADNPESGTGVPGVDVKSWQDLMGGFLSLKRYLMEAKQPVQSSQIRMSLDELLKKLVFLGESQGVRLEETKEDRQTTQATSETEAVVGQSDLFETDPVILAVDQGKWEIFFDPACEEKVDRKMPDLQSPERVDAFEGLWTALWNKIFDTDEKTQALCLRHMNRMRWTLIPRELQLEGLKNLRRALNEMRRPANYPIALTLIQDWVPQELVFPDWDGLLETVNLLKRQAERTPPLFEKQNLAAKVALETVFCEPVLESLLKRIDTRAMDAEGARKLFRTLGGRVVQFLYGKVEEAPLESPEWKESAHLLEAMQDEGHHVYESWLDWPEKRALLERFLEVFKTIPLRGEMQDYFERHWNTFSLEAQVKILEIVGQWKRIGFRPFMIRLLDKPDTPVALKVVEVLSQVGLEGDSKAIGEAVKSYPETGKDRDVFWFASCRTLGILQDPDAAQLLMEWAGKYKFMEKKKERSLEVRRVALEALANFDTTQVLEFLKDLSDSEKELKPDVEKALQSVQQKRTQT